MGAKEMVERIREEAREEGQQITADAKQQAEAKLEAARQELEQQKQQFIAAEERKGVDEKERIVRAARQNARKLKWRTEEAMIERTLESALTHISEVKRSGFKDVSYAGILSGLITESVLSIATGSSSAGIDLDVLLSEEDAAAAHITQAQLTELGKTLSSEHGRDFKLTLAAEQIKSVGGVIVRQRDGKIEVNNTFEQRRARFSTSLREEIVKALFEKTSS
ncbi:MAG: V-type ATP synthase subunit E [Candidatus Methanospirareceae archaeon]